MIYLYFYILIGICLGCHTLYSFISYWGWDFLYKDFVESLEEDTPKDSIPSLKLFEVFISIAFIVGGAIAWLPILCYILSIRKNG